MLPVKRPRTHVQINEFRRKDLVEATIKSMSQFGAANTSVRSIAALTGGSKGLVTHYYDGKEELLADAFSYLLTDIARTLREAERNLQPEAALKQMARTLFRPPLFDRQTRFAFLAFWDVARYSEMLKEVHSKHYKVYQERVGELFVATGALRKGHDARAAAAGLIAMIDGFWLELSLDETMISVRRVIAICDTYVDATLSGKPT
jgi:AcrR family transcriptional regulator